MAEHLVVLNLQIHDLNAETVRKAYRTESLKWHPDKPNGNAARFRQVRAAYEFLRDPANMNELIRAARSRQYYASSRQRVTQELTRESLRKERMAERLKAKEREAAWRTQEILKTHQKMQETFNAQAEAKKPHQYPSNYIPSSEEQSDSSEIAEVMEISRLAAMRNKACPKPKVATRVVQRVHAQHLVVDISDSSDSNSSDGSMNNTLI